MGGLGKIIDSIFGTRQRRATRYTSADSSTKALKELVQPRPTCCYQSVLLQPSESQEGGRSAYLDLALIFLLFRFSLLILFFLHLALIALNHLSCRSESSNKSSRSRSLLSSSGKDANRKILKSSSNAAGTMGTQS